MSMKIALAGNPNCGKTTLFNSLTGSNQYVGNWPGVTVEKKEGRLKGYDDVLIQDLPGIYSLSPYTLEEVVSRQYLVNDKPDAILNIVDGSNIERNLYLTTQLLDLGIPTVIAINMMDIVNKNGDKIDTEKLSRTLGCPVLEMSALKSDGTRAVADAVVKAAEKGTTGERPHVFEGSVEHAIAHIEESIEKLIHDQKYLRWYAIKVFERDERVMKELQLERAVAEEIEQHIADCEKEMDDDAESIITNERYNYISKVCASSVKKKAAKHSLSISDKIDKVVTNRVLGLPIFAVVMFLIYALAMGSWSVSLGTRATDFTNDVIFGEWVPAGADALLQFLHVGEGTVVYSLIQNGIVAGVGAVLGFVPQMLVLFLLLSILEDIGYMARVAFVMDRIFRQFGLSGKSFIPCLVATGCGVPGIMASRTIENDRDRKMTIMTTTFMPCGAKLPIIGLIAGAIFGGSPWIAASAYFIGIGSIILSGIILKKFKAFAGEPAPFVMELPAYHIPAWANVLRATWERGWSFIKRAGSVIVVSSVIIWFLNSFGTINGQFGLVEKMWEDEAIVSEQTIEKIADQMNLPAEDVNFHDASLLAALGNKISIVFRPLGFGSWKPTVATITGLVAKEEVVGTMGVLYNYDDSEEELGEKGEQIWDRVANDYTPSAAFSFMIFNLLCAPCFAAIGAIKREMNNRKWTWAAIGYMTVWAYILAFIVYQLSGLFRGELTMGASTAVALALIAVLVILLVRKGYVPKESKRSLTSVDANMK